jgi:hypothetical protein
MMKKPLLLTIILMVCLLAGCGSKSEKMCRIEIQDQNEQEIVSLEQQSQDDVSTFFDEDEWTECDNFDEKLVPKYVIELYQEKTSTKVQTDNKENYEKIMEYTTYEESDIVKVVICKDAIKSGLVSEADLTVYYNGSEKFFSALNNALE